MSPNNRRPPAADVHPTSLPHGTTQDQINEMESEGQGGATTGQGDPNKKEPKPVSTPPPHRPTKGTVPTRWRK
jgi:hypothetical protein